jgi:Mn2+/Fe2+ NRAMP family transporter
VKKQFRQLSNILFWSVLSAAFIGPGTVTTAAKAGSAYGAALLWALLFSVIATFVLQEMAARVTIGSGQTLGQVIRGRQQAGHWWSVGMFVAVTFGCAAYQTGNILGALSGLKLIAGWPAPYISGGITLLAFLLLWTGNFKLIARGLGLVVAFMGLLFLGVAGRSAVPVSEIASGALVPKLPAGSALLVIGLIGTTVVPYNLFLGAGLSKGQQLKDTRIGMVVAIGLGGVISAAVLLVGTMVEPPFDFAGLSSVLVREVGGWASGFFSIGLFAAGLSSAVTAPLAAAVAGQHLLASDDGRWQNRGLYFRVIWLLVLSIGFGFSLLQVQPVAAIILAQALNGLLLPFAAAFLLLAANDRELLKEHANGWWTNALGLLVFALSSFLGLKNVVGAAAKAFHIKVGIEVYPVLGLMAVGLALLLMRRLSR